MCTRYAAGVQVNGHRVEIITRSNIEEFMKPIITEWSSTVGSGKLPEQLIYFRDGKSPKLRESSPGKANYGDRRF